MFVSISKLAYASNASLLNEVGFELLQLEHHVSKYPLAVAVEGISDYFLQLLLRVDHHDGL